MNPVLVEATRGNRVESIHRGSVAICDSNGGLVSHAGAIDVPVFPRSAMKLIQALPLVESGAADAAGFGQRELSLACASHSSESGHVELAGDMLQKIGMGESDLACGAHWPLIGDAGENAKIELAKSGNTPTRLHNNCSGKHTGFLCCAAHMGLPTKGYVDPGHDLQTLIRATMEDLVGEVIDDDKCGIDGCSAPTFAVTLQGLAGGFAKMATGTGLETVRAKSAEQLMQACMQEPWYMAGTDRFCTRVMEIGQGRIFAKVGAEGVYTAAIPEKGLGIALKADDGADRASEMMLAGVLHKLLGEDTDLGEQITALTTRPIRDWNGNRAGELRSVLQ